MPAAPRYWTVAATHWREEYRAAHHIEALGLESYLPLTYAFDRSGEVERRVRLFPGFIFVKLCEGWQALCSGTVRGVRALLLLPLDDDTLVPARVRDGEIARLRGLEDEHGVVRRESWLRRGLGVRVDDAVCGPYAGVAGVVDGFDRGRVEIAFHMLGRTVRKKFLESALRAA